MVDVKAPLHRLPWYRKINAGATLFLSAQVFIKDVALSMPAVTGAVFSDNYFNLIPGEEKRVRIIADMGGKFLQIQGVNSSLVTLDL